ncbi:MAG: tetratricopeptide repeat protein [Syntrophales bacterium]
MKYRFALRSIIAFPVALVIVLTALAVSLHVFKPAVLSQLSNAAMRVRGTVSYLIMHTPPRWYYVDGERNGMEFRLYRAESFQVTYRDEFVLRSVSTDVPFDRGISADLEGVTGRQRIDKPIRGIDLIDQAMASGRPGIETGVVWDYRIVMRYKGEMIGVAPIKLVISPQDWLRYARGAGDTRARVSQLQRAVSMNPNDTGIRKMLAALLNQAGQRKKAAAQYEAVLSVKPGDEAALSELLSIYMAVHDYGKVIQISRRILQLHPDDPAILAKRGFAYGAMGFWDNAISNYEMSLKGDPQNETVRLNLGEAYERGRRFSEAVRQYRLVLKENPRSIQALSALGGASLKSGNTRDAIDAYRELVRSQPQNAAAHANLGLAYGAAGSSKEEIASYRKAIALNPGDPVVHFNLGVAYEKLKMEKEAAQAYGRALKLRPDDLESAERLADLEFRAGHYNSAADLFQKVAASSPRKAYVYAKLGFACGELKQYKLSAESYEKALKYGNKDPQIRYNLAYSYEKIDHMRDASTNYEKYAAVKPTAEVLNKVINRAVQEKNYDKALKYYMKLKEIQPRKAAVYEGIAHIYGLKGDIDREINYYSQCLRYDREDANVYENLGAAYEKKGMYADALESYRHALELDPGSNLAARRYPQVKILLLKQRTKP